MHRRNRIIAQALKNHVDFLKHKVGREDLSFDQREYFYDEIIITRNILHEYLIKCNNITINPNSQWKT